MSAVENLKKTPDVGELVRRSLELRQELASLGARVDAVGGDTAEGMRRCFEEELSLISLPRRYGGLSDGSIQFAVEALMEIATNLGATDASLCQNWGVTQLVIRDLFHAHELLPESTLRQLADEILNKGVRFTASNSEAGSPTPVTAREVPGGLRVSGVKTFNSNSGGGGYAHVSLRREGVQGRSFALIPLDAEGVRAHHDWDNMGQRGTCSQTITYDNVFVPDGWHYHNPHFELAFAPFALLFHSTIMLGSAMGALDAGIAHLRATNRVILKQSTSSVNDPLMMRRLGAFSAKLRAAHVLQRQVCRDLEAASGREQLMDVLVDTFRNKIVCVDTSLEVTEGLFDLTGARTTANKHRFDRFWRNARTFAVHDPVDVMQVWVGAWDLERQEPQLLAQFGS